MNGIMLSQLFVHIGTSALHGEEQETQEVEEWKRRIHSNAGHGTAYFLQAQRFVGAAQALSKGIVGLVRGAEVAGEEVWKDGARGILSGGIGFVLSIPIVL